MSLGETGLQKSGEQLELPFVDVGEAYEPRGSGEVFRATRGDERSGMGCLMEQVVERTNLKAALKRVKQNKGGPGIDAMTVGELPDYLKREWERIRGELLAGTYQPQPVKRKTIPKPGGGERELGIPTVLDRFIQQALLQVLQPLFDPGFSDHSYGFRPGRRAHQAIVRAQSYVQEGRRVVVDVDLAKFLDLSSHYTPSVEGWSKRLGRTGETLILKPLRRPRRRWTAWSSPRLTRCKTVCRDTPSSRVASCMTT